MSQSFRSGRRLLYYYDPEHCLRGIPAAWTSLAAPDPFLVLSDGKAFFRPQDLLELSYIIKGLRS